ncbi:hypothetical protein B0I35DRAFT_423366 [Stachybotrys elegans]|uniref:Uncharacterized protein n=1 Tax=Stachybotrys elegans TaxID=80388 RepID=A0A8K0T5U6_9HYPO|nr:hypothetical protein B0I35DRAFT_423366 [Stachybotrys elegans]
MDKGVRPLVNLVMVVLYAFITGPGQPSSYPSQYDPRLPAVVILKRSRLPGGRRPARVRQYDMRCPSARLNPPSVPT